MHKKTIAFTGGTGFIGKRLIARLAQLHPKARLISLVQEKFVETVKKHIAELSTIHPELDYSFNVSDITKPQLGLSDADYHELIEQLNTCYHLAAVYDLSIPEPIAEKINVVGTKHVIELCSKSELKPLLVYFSTCYVSGLRKGKIIESELEHSAGFKNHYEKTKYHAELLVKKALGDNLRAIIIRPGIVVGDSKTGQTDKFDGIYAAMNMAWKLSFLPLRLPTPGKADSEVNLIPVDYLVDATAQLAENPDAEGGTFQIADPNPIMAKDLYKMCCQRITGRDRGIGIPPVLLEYFLSFRKIQHWLGAPKECISYFNHPSHYDSSRTLKMLEGSQIRCPDVKDYFEPLVRFWEKHRTEQGYRAKF